MSYEKAFAFEAKEEFVELLFPDGTVVHIDRGVVEAGLLQHTRDQFPAAATTPTIIDSFLLIT